MEKQNKSLPFALSVIERSSSGRSGHSPLAGSSAGSTRSGWELQPLLPGTAGWQDTKIRVWALRGGELSGAAAVGGRASRSCACCWQPLNPHLWCEPLLLVQKSRLFSYLGGNRVHEACLLEQEDVCSSLQWKRLQRAQGMGLGGGFVSAVALGLEAVAKWQIPGLVGRWQTRCWAAARARTCNLLHLRSAPSTSPVSQGVRSWHLLHTEPTAATPGEQEKGMAQSPIGCSPTLCPRDLPTC